MKRQPTKALITLCVAALLIAVAGPASAKKPTPVPPEPALYEVSMTFFNEEPGLSTACDDQVSITMFGNTRRGTLELWDTDTPEETPLIYIRGPEVAWERKYPVPVDHDDDDVEGFDECHGPSVYNGPDHPFADHGGALWISIDYDAGTVDFRWHFDYYIDGEVVVKKNPRFTATISEHYTMSATATYDENGRVKGLFPVSWYLKEGRVLIHAYDPFEPINGTDMTFYMTVTPID